MKNSEHLFNDFFRYKTAIERSKIPQKHKQKSALNAIDFKKILDSFLPIHPPQTLVHHL